MTYELAKKLKDAGFPFKHDLGGVGLASLSELIEACGDSLTILENWGDGWTAYEERQDLIGKECKGKTPEEAVANLWLALNKQ